MRVLFLIFGVTNAPGTGSRPSRDLWRAPGTAADRTPLLCVLYSVYCVLCSVQCRLHTRMHCRRVVINNE